MKRISIDTPFGHKYPGPQGSNNAKFSIGSDMVGHSRQSRAFRLLRCGCSALPLTRRPRERLCRVGIRWANFGNICLCFRLNQPASSCCARLSCSAVDYLPLMRLAEYLRRNPSRRERLWSAPQEVSHLSPWP